MNLHVAGALEFFIDYVVHPAAGLYKRRGDYCKAAAVFNVPRRAEETLGLMQGAWVHAAGKRASGRGYGKVVCAGKPCYGVEQYNNVLALLNKPHRALLRHFGNAGMMLGQLVKRGIKHLSVYGALHVRNFLGAFVYQQNYQVNVGIVGGYSVGNVLEQRGLAGLGLAHYHAALALAYGGNKVYKADSQILVAPQAL